MVIELPVGDFLGCLHDQRRALGIEQTEVVIRLRRCPLDQPQGANKWPRKSVTAYRKVEDRAVSRSTMQRGCREGHLAHRIFFHARRPIGHAERSALTPMGVRRAVRYSQPFSDSADSAL